MNPADEEAAKLVPTEGQSPGAVAGSHDDLEEQLHDAVLKDIQRTNHQSKPPEDLHGSNDKLDERLRVSVEALLHPSPPPKPVEEVDDLLSAISHHLDDETSERKEIYNRLLAIEKRMERLASRGFRYLVAICIGVAAVLAWQSYGETTKQMIATRAPELGWSPGAKQMIAGRMQQLGWTKPLAVESNVAPVTQTAPETVAPKVPAAPSIDPEQVHQIAQDVAALRRTVEQLTAGQDQMAHDVEKLQAADKEILEKVKAPPPQPTAAPARKPTPVHPPPKLAPTPFWTRPASRP
jgi:hypothetical protein